jgi:hypothetical protein
VKFLFCNGHQKVFYALVELARESEVLAGEADSLLQQYKSFVMAGSANTISYRPGTEVRELTAVLTGRGPVEAYRREVEPYLNATATARVDVYATGKACHCCLCMLLRQACSLYASLSVQLVS